MDVTSKLLVRSLLLPMQGTGTGRSVGILRKLTGEHLTCHQITGWSKGTGIRVGTTLQFRRTCNLFCINPNKLFRFVSRRQSPPESENTHVSSEAAWFLSWLCMHTAAYHDALLSPQIQKVFCNQDDPPTPNTGTMNEPTYSCSLPTEGCPRSSDVQT